MSTIHELAEAVRANAGYWPGGYNLWTDALNEMERRASRSEDAATAARPYVYAAMQASDDEDSLDAARVVGLIDTMRTG